MNTVGKLGSYISRSVYTVSGPFHPFGGAVDIVVVEQQDGSFKSSPWYVRFGKFQGVLKAKEKVVSINVNGVDAGFHMYLDNKGEAYFLREVDIEEGDSVLSLSSSGEDTDGQSTKRMLVKSTSCNCAGYESDSVTQIDISNVRVASRTNSRRSRILGLVFGRKSVKQGLIEQDNVAGVMRTDSFDRAEIAADLLEVKWSTNLASSRCSKKTGSLLSSQDVLKRNAREDMQIIDKGDNVGSLINDTVVDNSVPVEKIGSSNDEKDHSPYAFPMRSNRLAEEAGIEMSCLVPESLLEKPRAEDDGEPNLKEPIKTGSLLVDDTEGSSNTINTISKVASAGCEFQDSMKHEFYPAEKCPNDPFFNEKHEGSADLCFFLDESEANGIPSLLSSETLTSSRSELDQSFVASMQTIDLVCEVNSESNSFLDEREREHSRVEDVLERTDYFVLPDNGKNTESPRISSYSMQKDDASIQTIDLVCEVDSESESFLDEKEHSRVEDVLEKTDYFALPDNGKNTESPIISSNSMEKDVGSMQTIELVCEMNSESTPSLDEKEHSRVEDVLEKTDYFVLPDNENNTERPRIFSNSMEKDVGSMHTIDLVCEINSESKCFLDEKEHSRVEDVLEKTDYFVLPGNGKNTESHRISSYSMHKDVISETCSQMINLKPSYSSVEDEPQSIFTVSTFSNSTCQPLVEQSMGKESEEIPFEASVPHSKISEIDPIQPNFFLAEVSEEERLLFGDLDDLKGTDSLDKDDPIVHLLYSSMDKPGCENLPDDVVDFGQKLKTISSEVNIPETSVSQPGQGHKIAKSLPNIPIHDPDLDGHYSDSKDAKNMEQLKTEIDPGVGDSSRPSEGSNKSWRIWSFPFKKSRSFDVSQPSLSRNNSDPDNIENKNDHIEDENKPKEEENKGDKTKTKATKKKIRVVTPTSEQVASLNLKEGKNTVVFTFSTPMLGKQQVDARIFLWKWDTRIVISDVDGTITRSDLLGQVMPWVGVDWSQTGVAHLFSAIKENGYQLLFLSARAISQAYHTRQFLFNLKQDGKALPDGPVVISPDGLFPSLYREVVRRAPHEFKISCLEDIKALFPPDRNPFYAGFGNRDTDEFSYLKVGIPKGKIFIINPKGQIVVNRFVDTKSYTSFHALVNDMFPSRTSFEQEDFNSWNFWKLPPPAIDV